MERDHQADRPSPDPIPFQNLAILTSLNEVSNFNTLDEYEQAKIPDQDARSSKYLNNKSNTNKNKLTV